LLRLDEPRGDDDGTGRARRQHPLDHPLGDVRTDGVEDEGGQAEQHAATERDEDVVDEPLAGEPDEVHPPLVRPDRPAHVRHGDHEPQHDGQMERDERLDGVVAAARNEVHHDPRSANGARQGRLRRRSSPRRRAK
jgi:hypothetical protein